MLENFRANVLNLFVKRGPAEGDYIKMVLANKLSVLACLHAMIWLESKTASVLMRRKPVKMEYSSYRRLVLSTSTLLKKMFMNKIVHVI